MITAIEIENFKAFGERQRIELRPITLLFGPNSGGKSSVTHAIHYLREVLCEENIDVHRTRSGGDSLDLGGIRNFLHGRTIGTPIRLKAEFTLDGLDLPDYPLFPEDDPDAELEQVRTQVTSASVMLEIDSHDHPMVRRCTVALNGEQFAELWMPKERPHAEIRKINWLHPVLMVDPLHRQILDAMRSVTNVGPIDGVQLIYEPKPGEPVPLNRDFSSDDARGTILGVLAGRFADAGREPTADAVIELPPPAGPLPHFDSRIAIPTKEKDDLQQVWRFEEVLSTLLFGPVVMLQHTLRGFRYVGPLRAMPPRQFEPRDRSGRSRWSNGLQAWDLLAHGHDMSPASLTGENRVMEEVSKWLEDDDRLDTGYRLEREVFKQVPSNLATMASDPDFIDRIDAFAETITSLPDHTRIVLRDVGRNLLLQPQDVGVGLSQIVPVIVALLDPGSSLVALEQPELHLHPRQQAALGDALIEGMTATPNRVLLVETHSEHLILRLLRRIRETTRKQALSGRSLTPDQLRIQYVRRDGSVSRSQTIDVDVNGDLVDPWPDDFFEQDFKERFS